MGLFDKLRRGPLGQRPPEQVGNGDAPEAGATYLTGTGRNFDGLDVDDQPVKFHVSEPIRQALDEYAELFDSNLSVVVRHILFVDLYGNYDLRALTERGNDRFMPYKGRSGDMEIRFSRSGSVPMASRSEPPDLGKNLDNIKVFLPERMVQDIDSLAAEKDTSRSVYIREALIRYLFGAMQLPKR